MEVKLQFLGAAGTVTGSKYLLTIGKYKVMIDCGLFQGLKELRLRNWELCPCPANLCDAVILTHAHIDHTGFLPRFVQQGFTGAVYATPSTVDLCKIMLPDSAHLQEEEARYANKVGSSKHKPAKPLYTVEDAVQALRQLEEVSYHTPTKITNELTVTFYNAGHILGSAMVECRIKTGEKELVVLFSGDLGRADAPILNAPDIFGQVHYLLVESTYGNRVHPAESRQDSLARVVLECVKREGSLLIPAFAIGRTQEILYCLRELEEEGKIPVLPVYVDSPMAIDATKLFQKHHEEHDIEMEQFEREGRSPFLAKNVHFMRSKEESMSLNRTSLPAIIISANGMATGGRIMHHLMQRLPDERNIVLFVGYQAEGTRGRKMLEGEKVMKLFGEMVPVRAKVEQLTSFSAHADANEILTWLNKANVTPETIFVTHGEPDASSALALRIDKELQWKTVVPRYLDEVTLA